MNEHLPIYNSRLIKNYIEYIHAHYPRIDANHLLEYAGMSPQEIEDPAHWFTQRQVDRFHEVLSAEANNPHISREAGRYAAFSKAAGPLKRYAMGFMGPPAAYRLLERITPHLTRGGSFKTVKLASNKMEVSYILKHGVKENPYQCENRTGQLEAISKIFTDKFAHIEHPVCVHRGGEVCRYIITWHTTPAHRWQTLRNLFLVAGGVLGLALLFVLPLWPWLTAMLLTGTLSLLCAYKSVQEEKRQLSKGIAFQGETAGAYLEEMQLRYNHALLLQDLGRISSGASDAEDLAREVVRALEKGLDFEAAMILLLNKDKSALTWVEGFGLRGKEGTRLKEAGLCLLETGHPFIKVLHGKGEPLLHQTPEEKEDRLSAAGMRSMICLPLLLDQEPGGVLAVGDRSSTRTITRSEVNFMMGIASQISLSMSNALAFQRLQESEGKYRELVENAASIILRRDASGNITFFNEYAERFFGYKQEEILGKNVAGSVVSQQDKDGKDQEAIIQEIGIIPERYRSVELEGIKRDGALVRVAWTHRALHDEAGRIKEILCVGNDVTALRKAEEEKRILEAILGKAQKMEALGTLAGGVAHDLNNILPSLISYPELILMDLPQDSPLRKPILSIKQSGEKAAALTQDLLTLARRGVTDRVPVDVNRVIEEYLGSPEFEKVMADQPHVEVKTRLDASLRNVLGAPIQIYKVIMNLVLNAAEAMPVGGQIMIATENRRLCEDLNAFEQVGAGDYAVITVADTGVGIASEDLEKIFEPFFTKKKLGRSGSGLGMAVVWGTVKDHQGFVDVQSSVGKGTTFTIFLPALKD
jgi:PAS domain S-box-containing protein